MRVLVTGAAGFVGYAVAERLVADGHTVTGLSRSAATLLPAGVRRHVGDLREPATLPGGRFDGVCHLAGLAQVRESRADPLRYWQTNIGGMLALLDWLPTVGADRLVIASTCAVYGEPDRQPIDETAPELPSSPYGSSKLAADRAAADLAATGRIGAISLRAFNITGAIPGRPDHDQTRLIPKLLAVAHGRAPEITINGDGGVIRDFLHVPTWPRRSRRPATPADPGTGAPTTSAAAAPPASATSSTPWRRSPAAPSPAAMPPPRREPPQLRADPARIRTELGWQPVSSSIETIIRDAWAALGDGRRSTDDPAPVLDDRTRGAG